MGWAVSYAVADKTFANKTKPKVSGFSCSLTASNGLDLGGKNDKRYQGRVY